MWRSNCEEGYDRYSARLQDLVTKSQRLVETTFDCNDVRLERYRSASFQGLDTDSNLLHEDNAKVQYSRC